MDPGEVVGSVSLLRHDQSQLRRQEEVVGSRSRSPRRLTGFNLGSPGLGRRLGTACRRWGRAARVRAPGLQGRRREGALASLMAAGLNELSCLVKVSSSGEPEDLTY